MLNATACFPGVLTDILRGMDFRVWVDGTFYFADTEEASLASLDEILDRLECVGRFVAANECTLFARKMVSCGEVYSKGTVSHDSL